MSEQEQESEHGREHENERLICESFFHKKYSEENFVLEGDPSMLFSSEIYYFFQTVNILVKCFFCWAE